MRSSPQNAWVRVRLYAFCGWNAPVSENSYDLFRTMTHVSTADLTEVLDVIGSIIEN